MKWKLHKGLTLVEVMAALVIALVIAIGMMNYQYACAQHARKTDVRVTASRLGLLFLESWVAAGGITEAIYDPVVKLDLGNYPLHNYDDLGAGGLNGVPPPIGSLYKLFRVFTNGTYFWIELAYDEQNPQGQIYPLRELGVRIAWSLDYQSETLDYDPQRLVRFSKSVIYVPPST